MASAENPLPYELIAGELCLDFVNSVGGRGPSGPDEDGHEWGDHPLDERLGSYAAT